jgi:hypothetical protein
MPGVRLPEFSDWKREGLPMIPYQIPALVGLAVIAWIWLLVWAL